MKICFVSDTHGAKPLIPDGADLLIHTGDFSMRGRENECVDFLKWFESIKIENKVFIAGNHDFMCEQNPEVFLKLKQDHSPKSIYLNDSNATVCGLKIFGSPVTPWFYDWAFNRARGEEIKKHWNLIPRKVDLLLTHGPPFGILDETARGEKTGCEDLLDKIRVIRPQIHAFGHIHEAYGVSLVEQTTHVNSCIMNLSYRATNKPVVIEV